MFHQLTNYLMMFRVFLFVYILNSPFAFAKTCDFFCNGKSKNHTLEFINFSIDCDTIIIHEGIYFFNFNKIFLKSNLVIKAYGKVEINGLENGIMKKENPVAIFTSVNPKNLKISNITFCDIDNRAYAIKIVNKKINVPLQSNVYITENIAKEIGLVWFGPKNGFTYNRIKKGTEKMTWYENGPILKNEWVSNIKINNNIIKGASKFFSGNFKKPHVGVGVSAITVLYSNNVFIKNNLISNYRFGIWIYGGSSLDRKGENLSTQPILCENISVKNNKIYETYSPIWFSKTSDIKVSNNYCENNQDVAIDFEGCYNAYVDNNTIINSRGGSLTVLNGSKNISFFKNLIEMINFNKQNNIVLIRNANENINYTKNKFIFKDSRILKKNARILLTKKHANFKPNSQINFFYNKLFEVELVNLDKSSLTVKN